MKALKIAALTALALLTTLLLSAGWILEQVAGAFDATPEVVPAGLSPGARALVERAFADVPPTGLRDLHVHVIGLDSNGNGASINPKMTSWAHPYHRIQFAAYRSGALITDLDQADEQYVQRLVSLARGFGGGRFQLLAVDYHHNPDGSRNLEKSEFYTPNEYVVRIAQRYPELFVAAISVHPYRSDALQELDRWARQGIRFVKWLPNAQGIDASDPRINDYYGVLRDHDMVLLTHVGEEQAVEAREAQALGNPLRFRRPLDLGVKVVMAHCASLGQDEDLDNPGAMVDSFSLFMRLMDTPRYDGLLFGELSAMTQFNRMPEPVLALLRRPDLHHRLVNGSDYPLPALNMLIHTRQLQRLGMITTEERSQLNEVYDHNPLLFDYVLKRTLHEPETGQRFAPGIFALNPAL